MGSKYRNHMVFTPAFWATVIIEPYEELGSWIVGYLSISPAN